MSWKTRIHERCEKVGEGGKEGGVAFRETATYLQEALVISPGAAAAVATAAAAVVAVAAVAASVAVIIPNTRAVLPVALFNPSVPFPFPFPFPFPLSPPRHKDRVDGGITVTPFPPPIIPPIIEPPPPPLPPSTPSIPPPPAPPALFPAMAPLRLARLFLPAGRAT